LPEPRANVLENEQDKQHKAATNEPQNKSKEKVYPAKTIVRKERKEGRPVSKQKISQPWEGGGAQARADEKVQKKNEKEENSRHGKTNQEA